MKTFASIAILALSAFTLEMEAEQYITKQPAYKAPDTGTHTHDQPVVHVNVWETINNDLQELNNLITALETEVNTQMSNVEMSSDSFDTFMTNINTLKDQNTMNSNDLATQKAIDASQAAKLEQLIDDITALEQKVSDLICAKELLSIRVSELQTGSDIALINMMIMQINETNMDLMILAQTQEDTLTDIVSDVTQANSDLDLINMNLDDLETDLSILITNVIDETTTTISDTTVEIGNLQGKIDNQKLIGDYFYQNPLEIQLDQNSIRDTAWEFCVPPGATLEYYLALSDQAGLDQFGIGLGSNTYVQRVNLFELVVTDTPQGPTTTEEFRAVSVQDDGQRGHQHTLIYKTFNDTDKNRNFGLSIESTILGIANSEQPAKIDPKNLSFSIRYYDAGYGENLFSTTPLTCP